MAENKMICHCKEVDYVAIRQAMVKGARTLEEIQEMTGAGTGCGGCIPDIEQILSSVCGCNNVSLHDVVEAVNNGARTVEEIAEVTGAGSSCGRCKKLVENIIKLKR